MNLDYSFFKVTDGQSLAYKKWAGVENPVGVIVIIHGMAEHIERYDHFARFLNSKGFIVYGTDQRGHGKTPGKKGLFTYNNTYKRVIDDQKEFYDFIKKEHPGLKIGFFAHSMGSYVLRLLLATYDIKPFKVVLSGTGCESFIKMKSASILSFMIMKFKGPARDGKFLDNILNGPYAKSIENPTSSFDWISRDKIQVAKYINDSNCGYICSNKYYYDLIRFAGEACKKRNIKKIDKNTPILLYSGDKDPVGGRDGSGVKKLLSLGKKFELDIQLRFNHGARHEIINELNKDEVYNHIIDFYLN